MGFLEHGCQVIFLRWARLAQNVILIALVISEALHQPCWNDKRVILNNICKRFRMKSVKKTTGYSIYNEEAKIRTRKNKMPSLYPDFPNKQFDIIYADPPWDYNGKLQFDKSSKNADEIDLVRDIFISSASFKYPTLKLDELIQMPVHEIAKDDCLLFLWATNPHLAQAITLGQTWGFEYRTVAFIWDKMSHNPGKYTLSNCELCLVFKRGRIPQPRGARNIQQLIRSPRRDHSMKPDEVRVAIEMMFPSQERIELFARGKYNGWTTWGLEILDENFIEAESDLMNQTIQNSLNQLKFDTT